MRYHEIIQLNEYRRDVTSQKLGKALLDKFLKEPTQWQTRAVGANSARDQDTLDKLLDSVENADPTKNKQYVTWIIRNYVNNPSLKFEDAVSKVAGPLQKFLRLVSKKQIPAPNNDIGRIKDLEALISVVDQYQEVPDQPKNINRGQAKAYYEDSGVRIIVPQDEVAACYYGKGTRWCTAADRNNAFNRYKEQGEMYIILPKKPKHTGEKYQFHFPSKQFMDEQDRSIDIVEFLGRYPQLSKVFAEQAQKYNVLAFLYDPGELKKLSRWIKPRVSKQLANQFRFRSTELARNIAEEILGVDKQVGKILNIRGLIDIIDSQFRNMEDFSRLITGHIDILEFSQEDFLYDAVSDISNDWLSGTEIWDYLEEIDDVDEGLFIHVGMALQAKFSQLALGFISGIYNKLIEEAKEQDTITPK